MDENEMTAHRDPDTTEAQEKLGELAGEIRAAMTAQGYPTTEAHAKISDFKAAVLARMWEELKGAEPPQDLKGWWRWKQRLAWLFGYYDAADRVFRSMMRQESWARLLRKPNRNVESD